MVTEKKTAKPKKAVHAVKAAPVPHAAERFVEAVGRRKTAVARVRIFAGHEKGIHVSVNGKDAKSYFPLPKLTEKALSPFSTVAIADAHVTAKVVGGGTNAQAEAVRLGIARALIAIEPNHRSRLKAVGFLKRDPRMVERKHPGLRKARRPQQWRKR